METKTENESAFRHDSAKAVSARVSEDKMDFKVVDFSLKHYGFFAVCVTVIGFMYMFFYILDLDIRFPIESPVALYALLTFAAGLSILLGMVFIAMPLFTAELMWGRDDPFISQFQLGAKEPYFSNKSMVVYFSLCVFLPLAFTIGSFVFYIAGAAEIMHGGALILLALFANALIPGFVNILYKRNFLNIQITNFVFLVFHTYWVLMVPSLVVAFVHNGMVELTDSVAISVFVIVFLLQMLALYFLLVRKGNSSSKRMFIVLLSIWFYFNLAIPAMPNTAAYVASKALYATKLGGGFEGLLFLKKGAVKNYPTIYSNAEEFAPDQYFVPVYVYLDLGTYVWVSEIKKGEPGYDLIVISRNDVSRIKPVSKDIDG